MSDIILAITFSSVVIIIIFILCCVSCYIYDKKGKADFTAVKTFDDNNDYDQTHEIEMNNSKISNTHCSNENEKIDVSRPKNMMEKTESSLSLDVPKGLPNLNNTCYLNALLQCLCWTPGLTRRLKKQIGEKIQQKPTFTYSLQNVLECMQHENGNTPRLRQLLHHLLELIKKNYPQFEYGKQQDTYELYNTLTSEISDEENHGRGEEYKEWSVSEMFTGELTQTFKYSRHCEHVDTNTQRYTSICVPVEFKRRESTKRKQPYFEEPNAKRARCEDKELCDYRNESIQHNTRSQHPNSSTQSIQSQSPVYFTDVENGIKNFFRTEYFPDINCRNPNCGQGTGCNRESYISSVPPVLVLLINKLKQTGRTLEKVQSKISFPDTLDLKELQVLNENVQDSGLYYLYAVVCHIGNLKGGHYYAYIRVCDRKVKEGWPKEDEEEKVEIVEDKRVVHRKKADKPPTWYCADDTNIEAVKESSVLNDANAYMLFFKRKYTCTCNQAVI